jgi:hypothetical protein
MTIVVLCFLACICSHAQYGLDAVEDMIITNNYAGGTENGGTSSIGIVSGGSTPHNGTGITNLKCSGNHPTAKC